MNEIRRKLKAYLRRDDPKQERDQYGLPVCPLTGKIATQMHEIIEWPGRRYGDKYGHRVRDKEGFDCLAEIYFVKELCVLLDGEVNVNQANIKRDWLLGHQAGKYGVQAVVTALVRLGRHLNHPYEFIPRFIMVGDKFNDITIEEKR
ncbi:MAG: hypothetical protein XU15_C0011G0034 [candidate division NC10 bacterium CSP1-5]|nr:MAG: hypothetical protein XU15_C0011G0034 [candidate division NC10 bacterium CSP1-5]